MMIMHLLKLELYHDQDEAFCIIPDIYADGTGNPLT